MIVFRTPKCWTGPAHIDGKKTTGSWRAHQVPQASARVTPEPGVRFVNVVDLMRLQDSSEHPHGLSNREFDMVFTEAKPVIFAYHGYPWLIHRLFYRRSNDARIHVRGYQEEGTTTPFDMVMLNDLDRHHLVIDVIDRVRDWVWPAARGLLADSSVAATLATGGDNE